MFSFFNKSISANSGNAYDYKFNSIDGGQINLSDYKDKVIVIVNVASRCGYTPQYEDLQSLYNNFMKVPFRYGANSKIIFCPFIKWMGI